jgi:hypothetical protein
MHVYHASQCDATFSICMIQDNQPFESTNYLSSKAKPLDRFIGDRNGEFTWHDFHPDSTPRPLPSLQVTLWPNPVVAVFVERSVGTNLPCKSPANRKAYSEVDLII